MITLYPLKLPPSLREKIWGCRDLAPLFPRQDRPIGEAWYSFEENVVANGLFRGRTLGELVEHLGQRLMGTAYQPSGLRRRSAGGAAGRGPETPAFYFPILSKLLFTADRLSVQVHPDDSYGLAHEDAPGKTEMWYVVRAARDASIALGLTRAMTAAEMAGAARTGEIAQYLNWVEVREGQALFVPPGTLHAIGPGLVLCEIQQNSDLTYRFFDFGRLGTDGKPRDLHIEQAAAVTRPEPHPGPQRPFLFPEGFWKRELLAACRYFATERLEWTGAFEYGPDPKRAHLLLIVRGEGRVAEDDYQPGDAYLVPAEAPPFAVQPGLTTVAIRSYLPDLPELRAELERAGAAPGHIENLLRE